MIDTVAFGLDDVELRARYDRLFASCPDGLIQQSTYWAETIQDLGPDHPIFLLAMDGRHDVGGLPLYLFHGRPGRLLTSVPQAGPLGGVFVRPCSDPDPIYRALLLAAEEIARARQCLALTIITNPIDPDADLYRKYLNPTVTFENFTQVVNIDRAVRNGELVLRNNKKGNPAATIRKAEAAQFTTKLGESQDEFDAWYVVHIKRAQEIGTSPLNRKLVERIWRSGENGRGFLQLVLSNGRIVAGCLFAMHRNVCDVFAISMDSEHALNSPVYLAIKAALLEMERRGVSVMNWQSSPRRGDGVYKFKKQWSSEERPYFFMTKVYCDEAAILGLGKEALLHEFPDHFVVPFGVFDHNSLRGSFAKGSV